MKKIIALFIIACSSQFIYAQTSASFNASAECFGNATQFLSTSSTTSGSIVNYEWDFDNDSVTDATGSSIAFVFDSAGVYNVRHTVTTSLGFVAIVVNTITVAPIPVSDFAFSGSCVGDTVQFTQNASVSTGFIQNYSWDFDGSLNFQGAATANAEFFFPGSGFYRVGLRVTTNDGCSADTFRVVQLTNKPNAAFDGENVCFGDETNFTNNSNVSTSILSYSWDLGDGNSSTSTDPNHQYASFGNYNVQLTATSAPGCSDTISKVVRVFAQPTAGLTGTNVCEGETTSFTNSSNPNGGEFDRYLWSFGDGNSVINLNSNLDYSYADTGNYNVRLAVRTINGCSDTTTIVIRVNPIPVFPITANGVTEFCQGGDVDLEVNSGSDVTTLWSTGATDSSINVNESGNYAILLFTSANCQYRDTINVTVNQPSALVMSSDTTINNGDRIDISASGASTYTWNGEESIINTELAIISVSPTEQSTYSVLATNEFGCESTGQITVDVMDDFALEPVNLFTPDGNGQNDFWVVQNIDRYPQCEVAIYDSWGQEIFNQTSYSNNWDGTFNGEQMPEATYYYRIACPGLQRDYNGFINLIRINK